MNDGHYWDLIARHLAGKTVQDEEEELRQWIKERPENADAYALQRSLWHHTAFEYPPSANEDPLFFKTAERWGELAAKIKKHERAPKSISVSFFLKIAASLLVAAIFGFFLIQRIVSVDEKLIVVRSPDHPIEITLPDKSKIWLNKNSSIRYPQAFNKSYRKVYLLGQAFFDVSKNKNKPFRIQAGSTTVEVLGTSFTVKARANDNEISVGVVTGKVAFYPTHDVEKKVILLPGNAGIFSKKGDTIEVVPQLDSNILSWRSGILTFKRTSIKTVIDILAEHYDLVMINKNPNLNRCEINTQFDNQPIEKVLKELKLLLDIQYVIKRDTVILSGGNCN